MTDTVIVVLLAFLVAFAAAALGLLCSLRRKVGRILMDLTKLQTAVAQETSVEQSAITLIQTIADELKAANASGDQAAVDALADQISSSAASLAAAVTANTGV